MDHLEQNILEYEYLKMTGIYFLYYGDKLVYIGKSVSIPARIQSHKDENVKHFDSVKYVLTDDLDEAEKFFIKKYNPFYNVSCNHKEATRIRNTYTWDKESKELYFVAQNTKSISKVVGNDIVCYNRGKIGSVNKDFGFVALEDKCYLFKDGKMISIPEYDKHEEQKKKNKKEIERLHDVMVLKGYKNGWLFNQFLNYTKRLYKSDLELIAFKCGYSPRWVIENLTTKTGVYEVSDIDDIEQFIYKYHFKK